MGLRSDGLDHSIVIDRFREDVVQTEGLDILGEVGQVPGAGLSVGTDTDSSVVYKLSLIHISEPTRRTPLYSSAASDVYKRQDVVQTEGLDILGEVGQVPGAGLSVGTDTDSSVVYK